MLQQIVSTFCCVTTLYHTAFVLSIQFRKNIYILFVLTRQPQCRIIRYDRR
nr:MAG TPA: hypothetical protein [Caudoviricetes sp.]